MLVVKERSWVDFKNTIHDGSSLHGEFVVGDQTHFGKRFDFSKVRVMPYSWRFPPPLSNFEAV